MSVDVQERREAVAHSAISSGEVAIFKQARLPYHSAIEDRFGVDKGSWKVLVDAIFPAAKSVDSVIMALSYCRSRSLDVFKRPVHIVPMWDPKAGNDGRGGYVETIWPGISELRTTAFRTGQYAGCDDIEFGPTKTQTFEGKKAIWENGRRAGEEKISVTVTFPEWARVTVYRLVGFQRSAFVGPKVYWLESYAKQGKIDVPNSMWADRPFGQIEKCAEAGALRRAFPEEIGNELTAEEMAGRAISRDHGDAVTSIPTPPPPPPPPPPPAPANGQRSAPPPHDPATGEVIEPARDAPTQQGGAATAADDMLDIPPALRRAPKEPQQQTDEQVLAWVLETLANISDPDALSDTWNRVIEPQIESRPHLQEDALGLLRRREEMLAP